MAENEGFLPAKTPKLMLVGVYNGGGGLSREEGRVGKKCAAKG